MYFFLRPQNWYNPINLRFWIEQMRRDARRGTKPARSSETVLPGAMPGCKSLNTGNIEARAGFKCGQLYAAYPHFRLHLFQILSQPALACHSPVSNWPKLAWKCGKQIAFQLTSHVRVCGQNESGTYFLPDRDLFHCPPYSGFCGTVRVPSSSKHFPSISVQPFPHIPRGFPRADFNAFWFMG